MGQYFDLGYELPDCDRPRGEGYEEARISCCTSWSRLTVAPNGLPRPAKRRRDGPYLGAQPVVPEPLSFMYIEVPTLPSLLMKREPTFAATAPSGVPVPL